jgi:hypothetical protein
MLRILAFLTCIALVMAAPGPGQTNINVGGMFRFEGNGPDVVE